MTQSFFHKLQAFWVFNENAKQALKGVPNLSFRATINWLAMASTLSAFFIAI
jgi:hypothetical protein